MFAKLQHILPYLLLLSTAAAQNSSVPQDLIQPQYNLYVYLAGPSVFLGDSDSVARSQIATCQSLGLNPLHPLNEIILQEDGKLPANVLDTDNRTANDWYMSDLGKIQMSAGVIGEVTAYRGPNMDPGTAFELGYATARGLKVVLWSQTANTTLAQRTEAQQALGDAHNITNLGTGQWSDIDTTPATENLMITRPETPVYNTFEEAAARMQQVLMNGADPTIY